MTLADDGTTDESLSNGNKYEHIAAEHIMRTSVVLPPIDQGMLHSDHPSSPWPYPLTIFRTRQQPKLGSLLITMTMYS